MTPKLVGAIACGCGLVAACITPPAIYSVANTDSYRKPFDAVWEQIVGHFARNNIQIKNIAKDSGVIYAESSTFGREVADCGSPGLYVPVRRSASLNVFVERGAEMQKVSVNTEFSETRVFSGNVMTMRCASTGALERGVLGAITP